MKKLEIEPEARSKTKKLRVGDAVLCRILNHTAPKTEVLHRHYVGLDGLDVCDALFQIQAELQRPMSNKSSL